MSIHPGIADDLLARRARGVSEGRILPEPRLGEMYATFQERFGPHALSRIDGEELLSDLHWFGSKDSLVYWLEYKDDPTFATSQFGSIAGGSALKYCVFFGNKSEAWEMSSKSSPHRAEVVPLDVAIAEARKHRDELVRGSEVLAHFGGDTSDDAYSWLQQQLDDAAPDVSRRAWGHKYFSLLFPDRLDQYHVPDWQRYQLVRLLQIPPEGEGRYRAAGRFVKVSRELGMPINHLAVALQDRHGPPRSYWRIETTRIGQAGADWSTMLHERIVSLSLPKLGDLSWVGLNLESKHRLRALMLDRYGVQSDGPFKFVARIADGDIVLASQGNLVVGIGRVTGSYTHNVDSEAAHRRPVEWLHVGEWRLSTDGGRGVMVSQVNDQSSLVEVERRLLEPPQCPTHPELQTLRPLGGISGRIQAILERKGQVILYGPPGTGKTHWAQATARELAARHNFGRTFEALAVEDRARVVGGDDISAAYVRACTFHPTYGYEEFLEGFRPEIVEGQMVFRRRDGLFKLLCQDAEREPAGRFYLVIDEINRGDVPRIFGELLTVLEKDKRSIPVLLASSGEPFAVPPNVYVVGTMNTADRSIALLDAALRRRFGFVELMPDTAVLGAASAGGVPLGPWLAALNDRIRQHVGRDGRNLQVGHSYLLDRGIPITDLDRFAEILRDDIVPLLEEYTYEDFATLEKILGDKLVDTTAQRIRGEYFEHTRHDELVTYLLAAAPEITTTPEATAADEEGAVGPADDDVDPLDDIDEAGGALPVAT